MTHWYIKAPSAMGGTGRAEWAPGTVYTTGDRVVCRRAYATVARRRYVYECTTGGTSHGATEPTWPTTGTVNDNGVVWTLRNPTSWANATLYIEYLMTNAATIWSAGDSIWADNTIDENCTEAMTLGGAPNQGSMVVPTNVISTSDIVNEPPTSRAAGAKFRTIGTLTLSCSGVRYYGVTFEAGYGASAGTLGFVLGASQYARNIFDTCALKLAYAVTGCSVLLGNISSSYNANDVLLINTTIEFTHAGQYIWLGGGSHTILGGGILGTAPTTLLHFNSASFGGMNTITGMDLSLVESNLIDTTNMGGHTLAISRCKLNSNVTLFTGNAPENNVGAITVELCDSGTKNYKLGRRECGGTLMDEVTYVRTGGASDGTTPIAWKMVTNANAAGFDGVVSPWMATWIDEIGSARTLTIEILHDSATALTNLEIWLEVCTLTTATWPLAALSTDRGSPGLTGTAQDTSTAEWYTTGITNVNKQRLEVSVTPQLKGVVTARVRCAKASYTVFIDPKIRVT